MAYSRRKVSTRRAAALRLGFRSGIEGTVNDQLKASGIVYGYEALKLTYVLPASKHTYTPDFIIGNNPSYPKMVIETKGRFVKADREKHLLVRETHPGLDIRFVFSNSKGKLYKGSSTSYGGWCDKYGFKYADKVIPESWLQECLCR